jgi:hypothetical protein
MNKKQGSKGAHSFPLQPSNKPLVTLEQTHVCSGSLNFICTVEHTKLVTSKLKEKGPNVMKNYIQGKNQPPVTKKKCLKEMGVDLNNKSKEWD